MGVTEGGSSIEFSSVIEVCLCFLGFLGKLERLCLRRLNCRKFLSRRGDKLDVFFVVVIGFYLFFIFGFFIYII